MDEDPYTWRKKEKEKEEKGENSVELWRCA
jgi:hypothetical protein